MSGLFFTRISAGDHGDRHATHDVAAEPIDLRDDDSPFDGQFRVQDRECAPEGVLAASRTVPDDRARVSLSGYQSGPHRRGGETSYCARTVTSQLQSEGAGGDMVYCRNRSSFPC
jgi:hypothetical protein